MKNLAQLYLEYGQLMVQSEIISGKIGSVKQQIQETINQPTPSDFKEVKVPQQKETDNVKSEEVLVKPKKMTAPKKSKKK